MNTRFVLTGVLFLTVGFGLRHGPAYAGDVTSTRQLSSPFEWSAVERWDHEPGGVSSYPHNGLEDHTYDVVLPDNNFVILDVPVEIDSLNMLGTIQLNANTLSVLGPIMASNANFSIGTVTANSVSATQNIGLNHTNLTTQSATLNGNATLTVQGNSTFKIENTLTFAGDGDLNAITTVGTMPKFDLDGASIQKNGGGSASDITAPVMAGTLTVGNLAANTALRFQQFDQNWNMLHVSASGEAGVEINAPLSVNNISFNAANGTGKFTLKGPTTLGGTISSMGGSGSAGVYLSANFGSGALSGGVTNCMNSCPFVLTGNAEMGTTAEVTNMGRLVWEHGRLVGSGIFNAGTLVTASSAGARQVLGATLTNSNLVFQYDQIRLGENGMLRNEAGAKWFLEDSIVPTSESIAFTTKFVNEGTLEVGTGSGTIGVPLEASGAIEMNIAALTVTKPSVISNVAISTQGGRVKLMNGEGVNTLGNISLKNLGPQLATAMEILGDSTSSGTISDDPAGAAPVSARVHSGGNLSGGTLAMGSGQPGSFFEQTGGIVGTNAEVRNTHAFVYFAGEIGSQGLRNDGLLTIDSVSSPGSVKRIRNLGEVVQKGPIILAFPGVQNEGTWRVSDPTAPSISQVLATPGSFLNLGTFRTDPGGNVGVGADFDNSGGTVIADEGTINFVGNVLQYDPRTKTLSGGKWVVKNGGAINFPMLEPVRVISNGGNVELLSADDVALPFSEVQTILVDGGLKLTGDTLLDLTGNGNNGDLDIAAGGEITDGEQTLLSGGGNLLGGPSPTKLIVNNVYNRGRFSVLGGAVLQANSSVQLLDDGQLVGYLGVVQTPQVVNASGHVRPGVVIESEQFAGGSGDESGVGMLMLDGEYIQQPGGTLEINVDGDLVDDADQLAVSLGASLAGTLEVVLPVGYDPPMGTTHTILSAGSVSGYFDAVNSPVPVAVTIHADRVDLILNPAPAQNYAAFLDCLKGPTDGLGTGCETYDADSDGDVDLQDFAAFQAAFLGN